MPNSNSSKKMVKQYVNYDIQREGASQNSSRTITQTVAVLIMCLATGQDALIGGWLCYVIGCAPSVDWHEIACAQSLAMTCDLVLYLHWFSTKVDEQITFDVHDRQARTCLSRTSRSMPSSKTVKLSELWTLSRRTNQGSNIMLFMWSTLEAAVWMKYAILIKLDLTWL